MIMVYVAGLASGEAGNWLMTPSAPAREVWHATLRERFSRIEKAADVKNDGQPLAINHRLAFKALTEASITDDVAADYLGGVLAASEPDDDAGAAIVALIGRLSSQQLRLHYLIYREFRRVWRDGKNVNLHDSGQAKRAGIRLALTDLIAALGPSRIPGLTANITVFGKG